MLIGLSETLLINSQVADSIVEDVGTGDITAELVDADKVTSATVISREKAVICGRPWFDAVFQHIDSEIQINWHVEEGQCVTPNQQVVSLSGNARSLLTGERIALNWLQTLSGVATVTAEYVALLSEPSVKLLDTRKTIPGLRYAQKYAVSIGGGVNHRFGLFDAYLIKENHIMSCGSISNAIALARQKHPEKIIEIEVENCDELLQALDAKADIIMLDNFSLAEMKKAVAINNGRAQLEVSGNVTTDQLKTIAKTGVHRISVGALTKHVRAIDFSMRFSAYQS